MINIIITACHQGAFCHEPPRRTRESHTGPAPFFPGSRAGGSSTGQTRHYSSHTHTHRAHTEGSPVPVPAPIKPPNLARLHGPIHIPPPSSVLLVGAARLGFDPSHGAGPELGGGHGGRRAGAGSWARGRPGGDEGGGGEEGPGRRRRRQEGARVGVRLLAGAHDAARAPAHGAQPWLPVAVRDQAFGGVDAGVRREPGAVVRGLGLGRVRGGGGGRAGGHRRGGARGRVVLAQRQRGLLPDGLLRAGRPRRRRRRPGRRRLARQRRGRRRLGAQETAPLQGAGRVPGGELQGAQHPQPQAESGAGEAAEPPAAPGGGVVPEPESQDEAEADGGGLRVPEAVLRDADGGEPAAAEGAGGAARAQDGAPLLHAPPGDHPLHVPVLRARRLQLRPGLRRGPLARTGVRGRGAHLRRRHWGGSRSGAEQALVVRRAVLVGQELPAGLSAAPSSIAGTVKLVTSPAGEGRACL